MKHVLFVASVYKHFYAFHIPYIQILRDNGCRVDLIAARDDREIVNADNCYDWELTRSPFNFKNIRAYQKLKKLIESENYDLIHCHTATASVITRLAARTMRKKNGTKVLYTAHGFHFFKGAPQLFWLIYYPVEKFLSRFTDGIVLVNAEDYNCVLTSGFKNKKTYFINGIGINTKRFVNADIEHGKKNRVEEGYNEKQFLMIYVAEFTYGKNHKFLVDASIVLANKVKDFKILFVGRGVLKNTVQKYTNSIGANKYIDFLDFRFDLDRLFPMCDVGVSSSRREGMPLSLAEAMLCNLPVIATQDRGHRELVIHGETGFLFKQNDLGDFVKYTLDLYENSQKKIDMGKAANVHAQKFRLEKSLKKMADIYEEMLNININI